MHNKLQKSIGRNLRHQRRRFCSSSISNVIFQGNIETFNLVGIGPRIWKNYVTLSRYIAVVNEGFLSIFFFVKVKASISNYLSIRDRIETWEFVFGRFSLVCFFGWHVLEANVKGTQPHNLHHESRSNSPTTREQQQRQLALTAACYSPTPFSSLQKTALLPTFHSSCCILVVLQNSVMNTKSQK